MQTKLLVGTSKGLVVFQSRNFTWKIASVQFQGLPVSMVYLDERTHVWWVGISHRHWGEKLHCSLDEGSTWQEVSPPNYDHYSFHPNQPATLRKIWCIQHAGIDRPEELWLGTEPGGLFYSRDNGRSFHLNESLWNHPSRLDAHQWFGAGKDYPFIHSIVVDPSDSDHVYVGVSCAGVFETRDGGKKWLAKNQGLVAAYLPNPKADAGHDPHRLLACSANPRILWQQNHCGIFRSTNGGEVWKDVSGKSGFPKYGFGLAIDEDDPLTAWVIPAKSDEQRVPVDLRLMVCKTIDGGEHWSPLQHGLPDSNTFDIVLRHAFVKKDKLLAFGTNNGNLYIADDRGDHWKSISQNLAAVNCLAFA